MAWFAELGTKFAHFTILSESTGRIVMIGFHCGQARNFAKPHCYWKLVAVE
jgi:hypothetical protein